MFKFAGLIKRDDFDTLADVSQRNLIYFLASIGCTILIDQVMYSHFKESYSEFQKMTLYPKMEIGWINANPWMVFHQNVRLSRNLHKDETITKFMEFSKFFVQDLKDFFNKNTFENVKWEAVKTVMVGDSDVTGGECGEIFKSALLNM